MRKNIDFEKEKFKINLSFGLIAIYTAFLVFVDYDINQTGFLRYLALFFYGSFGITCFFLFLFIIFTAAKYRDSKINFMEGYLTLSEKKREYFYNMAFYSLGLGFFTSINLFSFDLAIKYTGKIWVGFIINTLIATLIYFFFRKEKIEKNKK